MNKIKLIAIIGKSASGKDTLFKSVMKNNPNLNPIIHYTSRPRRPGETDGEEYFFKTKKEFIESMDKGEFFPVTIFNDWLYGIDVNSFNPNKINIGIFNAKEIKHLVNCYSSRFEIYVVETVAEDIVRYQRSLRRLETKPFDLEGLSEMCRRYKADEEDFEEIAHIKRYKLYTDNFISSSEENTSFVSGLVYGLGYLD